MSRMSCPVTVLNFIILIVILLFFIVIFRKSYWVLGEVALWNLTGHEE